MIPNDDLYTSEFKPANAEARAMWLRSLKPGDELTRIMGGIRIPAVVVRVDEYIHINATDRPLPSDAVLWKFSRMNGAEVDEDLGWNEKQTGSVIVPKGSTETMRPRKPSTGDSGTIGEELLQKLAPFIAKYHAIDQCVKDGTFTLEEALQAYEVKQESYEVYKQVKDAWDQYNAGK